LLTKWTELAAFQPIDRYHTAKGTGDQEPWVHGIAHEAIRRRYIEERYRLMPYLYTLAEEMSRTGVPIVRPLFLEFPNATSDGHPIDLDAGGEFLFGPDLLVAPAPFPDMLDPYELKLPPGDWYDYWTGNLVAHITATTTRDQEQPVTGIATTPEPNAPKPTEPNRPILITPTLESLPVYVRGGAILPIQPLVQSTSEVPQGPLTLRVYPGENCHGTIYQDDGISFSYKQGNFFRMDSTCAIESGQLRIHIGPHQGTFHPWWKQLRVEVYGWHSPSITATANGSSAQIDQNSGVMALTLDDPGSGLDITLK
ncbi:MAG TPA: TIM-barrel domain-containing protein, partial [Edaphobacter sp.]